jgi:hypothetical protein
MVVIAMPGINMVGVVPMLALVHAVVAARRQARVRMRRVPLTLMHGRMPPLPLIIPLLLRLPPVILLLPWLPRPAPFLMTVITITPLSRAF